MLNHLPKICPVCKNTFYVKPSHFDRRIVCSKSCQSTMYKTQMKGSGNPHYNNSKKSFVCKQCGKETSYYPSMRKEPKFCSLKCVYADRKVSYTGSGSPSWRGGHKRYYGSNWIIQQERARQRDKYTCQRCGITEKQTGRNLDVHHKKQFNMCANYQEANQLENLICLCRKCHRAAEAESRKQYGDPDYKQVKYAVKSPMLTPAEAAEIIGITVWAVYSAIETGRIRFVNLCEGIASRKRSRFAIHVDDAKSYKKRYK